jgi:hypothetical protein
MERYKIILILISRGFKNTLQWYTITRWKCHCEKLLHRVYIVLYDENSEVITRKILCCRCTHSLHCNMKLTNADIDEALRRFGRWYLTELPRDLSAVPKRAKNFHKQVKKLLPVCDQRVQICARICALPYNDTLVLHSLTLQPPVSCVAQIAISALICSQTQTVAFEKFFTPAARKIQKFWRVHTQ